MYTINFLIRLVHFNFYHYFITTLCIFWVQGSDVTEYKHSKVCVAHRHHKLKLKCISYVLVLSLALVECNASLPCSIFQ